MRRVLKKSGQLSKTNWDAVIRVYDEAGNVIETHDHTGDFKEFQTVISTTCSPSSILNASSRFGGSSGGSSPCSCAIFDAPKYPPSRMLASEISIRIRITVGAPAAHSSSFSPLGFLPSGAGA